MPITMMERGELWYDDLPPIVRRIKAAHAAGLGPMYVVHSGTPYDCAAFVMLSKMCGDMPLEHGIKLGNVIDSDGSDLSRTWGLADALNHARAIRRTVNAAGGDVGLLIEAETMFSPMWRDGFPSSLLNRLADCLSPNDLLWPGRLRAATFPYQLWSSVPCLMLCGVTTADDPPVLARASEWSARYVKVRHVPTAWTHRAAADAILRARAAGESDGMLWLPYTTMVAHAGKFAEAMKAANKAKPRETPKPKKGGA